MTVSRLNTLSLVIAIISLVFLLFALFAPTLFTAYIGLPDRWDFTEKGQIGDTIGGTMGPFIAIAGVLMTFIAFLMQVNANRIQSEQLKKSFDLRSLENKLASRNALELLSVDITIMLSTIDSMCKEIVQFCENTKKVPTGEYQLHFVSSLSVNRYQTLDRNLLYDAFQFYVEDEDKKKLFMDLYLIMDYSADGIKSIHENIYMPFIDDIISTKNLLPEAFKEFQNKLFDRLDLSKKQVDELFVLFNNEVRNKVITNGVLNILELNNLLLDENYRFFFNLCDKEHFNLLSLINALINKNNMLVTALSDAITKITDTSCQNLKDISAKVNTALSLHTQEKIQAEFEGKL